MLLDEKGPSAAKLQQLNEQVLKSKAQRLGAKGWANRLRFA